MATFTGTAGADTADATGAGALTGFTGGTLSELVDGFGDTFIGLGSADSIIAGSGDDMLDGGFGADTLNGGEGNDIYMLGSEATGVDTVIDSGGTADLIISSVTRSLAGFATIENLTLVLGLFDPLRKGTGNDLANVITGTDENDVLDGGAGLDTLIGLDGNDTYVLGDGSDIVQDKGGFFDRVTSTISRSLQAPGLTTIEGLTLLSGNINGTGNNLDNIITGSTGNNILDCGPGGFDQLHG
jgi:Ca2+-binding RTX toxin-like protein